MRGERCFLIDGSGFIYRAFHALPALTRADGAPVGAVLGFTNILLKFLAEIDAEHLAVVFDAAAPSFRTEIYPAYKANRTGPPRDLAPQFAMVREATDAFDVCRIELPGYEADDLIATYARRAAEAGAQVTIVSSDKDLMQLVGPHVTMLDPLRNRPVGPAEVREKFGVGPDRVVDVQALCGDSVDNVPGIPGIGVKTAAELILAYGDLDAVLARAGEIPQPKRRAALIAHAAQARLSQQLVRLDANAPSYVPLSALRVRPLDMARIVPFLRRMGFRAIEARLLGTEPAAAASGPSYSRGGRNLGSPAPGYWLVRLVKGGPLVPAAILAGPPLEAAIAGEPAAVDAVWTTKGQPICADEYAFRCADAAWAREHAPHEPAAQPRVPVDLNKLPPVF